MNARIIRLLPLLIATLGLSGCLAIADRAITQDINNIEQEFKVFQGDGASIGAEVARFFWRHCSMPTKVCPRWRRWVSL